MRVTVVVPTYNEAQNLPVLVEKLFKLKLELKVLVVDDNSPDGTGKIADELSGTYSGKMEVIHRTGKLGLASAYVEGIGRAVTNGADVVVQMDADMSHPVEYVPLLVSKMWYWDVAVGSRYVEGSQLDNKWGIERRAISWLGNQYIKVVTGLKVKDTSAGFKAYRREVFDKVDLREVQSKGYAFQMEVAYMCQRAGLRVTEVPILFKQRVEGESKMGIGILVESLARPWKLRLRDRTGNWSAKG